MKITIRRKSSSLRVGDGLTQVGAELSASPSLKPKAPAVPAAGAKGKPATKSVPKPPSRQLLKPNVGRLNAKLNPGGGGSVDVIALLLASGATFVEQTGCSSGTPYTYWAPEWASDPS